MNIREENIGKIMESRNRYEFLDYCISIAKVVISRNKTSVIRYSIVYMLSINIKILIDNKKMVLVKFFNLIIANKKMY